jgi:hypothetical protein
MTEQDERVKRILTVALEQTRLGQIKWVKGLAGDVYRASVGGGTLRISSRDRDGAAPFVFEVLGKKLNEVGGRISSDDETTAPIIRALYEAARAQIGEPDSVLDVLEHGLGIQGSDGGGT